MSEEEPKIEDLHAELYAELRQLAWNQFARQPDAHTLQPTALVNEVWLKLAGSDDVRARGRDHFLCLAARVMRQVLVDHARAKLSEKRGEGWRRITLLEGADTPMSEEVDLLSLEDALQKLSGLSEVQTQLIELRFFGGTTMQEAADTLRISLSEAERKWRMARAWLAVELREA